MALLALADRRLGVVDRIAGPIADPRDERLYRARGQAESLIRLHKFQLKSDRTSCRSPLAHQMRLILHTAAYWLMLRIRASVPKAHPLAKPEFATISAKLLRIGARIRDTAHRVRIPFAAACPEAELFQEIDIALRAALA